MSELTTDAANSGNPKAGWYADPLGGAGLRWWDGASWTTHVHDGSPLTVSGAADDVAGADSPAQLEAVAVAAEQIDETPTDVLVLSPAAAEEASLADTAELDANLLRGPEGTVTSAPIETEAQTRDGFMTPPGFFPDPFGEAAVRWWDGHQWTSKTAAVDPDAAASIPSPRSSSRGPGSVEHDPWAVSATAGSRSATLSNNVLPPGAGGMPFRPASGGPKRVWLLVGAVVGIVALLAGALFGLRWHQLSAARQLAKELNLQTTDVPSGYTVVDDETDSKGAKDAKPGASEEQLRSCLGEPGGGGLAEANSPQFVRAQTQTNIQSFVTVMRSTAAAQRDLAVFKQSNTASCVRTFVKSMLQDEVTKAGVQLGDVRVTQVPRQPANSFALTMSTTLRKGARSLPISLDMRGFVQGKAEVLLITGQLGGPVDSLTRDSLLRMLQQRAQEHVSG